MIRWAVLAAAALGFTVQASDPALDAAIADCAPNVAASTVRALIAVESGGNPLALTVNDAHQQLQHQPTSEAQAVSTSRWLIDNGYNFDAGLAQINSANFGWLGLNDRNVFNRCINLAAAETVLRRDYVRALDGKRSRHPVLAALSRYNTGSDRRGFTNGYVRKVQRAAARDLETAKGPQIGPIPLVSAPSSAEVEARASTSKGRPAMRPSNSADVFGTDGVADVYQAPSQTPGSVASTDAMPETQP